MSITRARRIRIWVASVVVAAYAFGILGPTLAFSLENKVSIVHSLTEAHGGSLILHLHHDDADHQAPGKQGPHVGHHCCGVFALAGLSSPAITFSAAEGYSPLVTSEPSDERALRQPSRLDRPPRSIL